ncbi:MAG TPA: hypothetical protein VNJ04_20785, partial [Gemmatimonadaceae bacterium]|nr:hypothetical protein [Gemmatimonadaceae bacterium]
MKRAVELVLPANYEFSFAIRGQAPNNTLEFKLVDPSGENVWWSNTVDYTFPREWTTYRRKKRQISFAWGPVGGGDMKRVASIELAITAGTGGKGSVWLDDLTLTPLELDRPYDLTPRITRSADSYDIDFLKRRELGALTVDWPPLQRAVDYDVLGSTDGALWQSLYRVRKTRATTWLSSFRSLARDYVWIPETDVRYLRLRQVSRSSVGPGSMSAVRDVSVKPLDWAPTKNDMLLRIAGDASRTGAPKGSHPKYLGNVQSYWTVIGADRDSAEGLINEEGMIEVGRGQFSVEPFLFDNGKLITWADAKATVIAEPEGLPLPRVKWSTPEIELFITAFVSERSRRQGPSVMFARYRVTNKTAAPRRMKLFIVIRPLQVNPPWQFLNGAGGVARIDSISMPRGSSDVAVNGRAAIAAYPTPTGFVTSSFADGNIVDGLRTGAIVSLPAVSDAFGLASGAMEYPLTLAPGATSAPIDIEIPLHGNTLDAQLGEALSTEVVGRAVFRDGSGKLKTHHPSAISMRQSSAMSVRIDAALARTRAEWREKLGRVTIGLPSSGQRHIETMRANLAYILINRDGAAIQPGSRSYSRSWIRDGSLTSTALLRLGHPQAVREFIEWYAPYQYDNGKIPCCVDEHGATPVPENDSHGQFIYLVAEYYRHTGDRALMEKMWPRVMKVVSYMDSLRQSRMTAEFESGDKRIFYGLLPQSISHEGYSAKPMHSYWDDTFALRGFKDAAWMAEALNKPEAKAYRALEAAFRKDFYASMELVMKTRNIDHLPASAELADFDATSTTTMISPGGEMHLLPQVALNRTFDKYFTQEFVPRANGTKKVDGYTPYEL